MARRYLRRWRSNSRNSYTLPNSESASGMFEQMPDSSLWTLYDRLRSEGAALSMRRVAERSEIYPVFHDLFHKRQKQEKVAS